MPRLSEAEIIENCSPTTLIPTHLFAAGPKGLLNTDLTIELGHF